MSLTEFEFWPAWPENGLEFLGHCPVCRSDKRSLLYEDLIDRLFGAPGKWSMYLCDECESGYLDPRPNEQTIGIAYTNYITHTPTEFGTATANAKLRTRLRNGYLNSKFGYEMRPASRFGYLAMHLLPPPYRLEWDHFARHLSKPTEGRNRLLDVGCGNGEFLLRAKEQGWDVKGIDLDPIAIAEAKKNGLDVVVGAVEKDQFKPNSFDVVTCQQVIEHVHDVRSFLLSLRTWLHPGGKLWIGTPNISSNLRLKFGKFWHPLHPPQHLQLFNPISLKDILLETGFMNPRLLSRGYNETHCHRISTDLSSTELACDFSKLTLQRKIRTSRANSLWMEIRSWHKPSCGSDMVMIADKT